MAYLDLMETDPNRNRRNGLIVFFICVFLMGILIKCAGQPCVDRLKLTSDTNITRIFPCQGMAYEANGKEVFFNIFADSLDPHRYAINIYVYCPKDKKLNNPKLLINFEDNETHEIEYRYTDTLSWYVEFSAKAKTFIKLRDYKIDYFNFVNDDISYSFFEEKNDFFYVFMRGL